MSVLDLKQVVVLLLDCEEGVAERVLADEDDRKTFADSATSLVELASSADIPIVRVDVEFRAGYVDVAPSNAYFSAVKSAGRLLEKTDHTAPMQELTEAVKDAPRVVKRRIGGFTGTDLDCVLRGLGRSHLVLAGLITRGAVLSTACHGADLDYRITVVSDACADPDPKVHHTLLSDVLPLRADVVSLSELKEMLHRNRSLESSHS